MSVCLISDTYVTIEGAGEGGTLKVGYLDVPVRGTGYINSGPMDLPINDDGTYSFSPTWSAQTDPTTARLYILYPDGHAWGGLVPSVVGPVTLYQLKNSYGWGVVSESAIPVVTVQGPAADLPQIGTVTTTFAADGSITDVSTATGITVTTVFNANGSIAATYGSPLNRTVTTTFNADGSITEVTA